MTIWNLVLTGLAAVMITASTAVIVGLGVVIWTTRRID